MRPRRSKPSGSGSLPHRETPTHRLGLTAEEEHAFYADPANQVPKGPWVVGDADSVSRCRYVSPRLCWPKCVNAPRPMTDRFQTGSGEPSNTSCERTPVSHSPHGKELRFPLRVGHHGAPTFQIIAHEPRPGASARRLHSHSLSFLPGLRLSRASPTAESPCNRSQGAPSARWRSAGGASAPSSTDTDSDPMWKTNTV